MNILCEYGYLNETPFHLAFPRPLYSAISNEMPSPLEEKQSSETRLSFDRTCSSENGTIAQNDLARLIRQGESGQVGLLKQLKNRHTAMVGQVFVVAPRELALS